MKCEILYITNYIYIYHLPQFHLAVINVYLLLRYAQKEMQRYAGALLYISCREYCAFTLRATLTIVTFRFHSPLVQVESSGIPFRPFRVPPGIPFRSFELRTCTHIHIHVRTYFVVVAVQKTHTRPNGMLSTLLKRSACVFACLHLADSSSLSLSLVSPQVFSAPQTGLQSLQSYPLVSCSLSQEPVHYLPPEPVCHLSLVCPLFLRARLSCQEKQPWLESSGIPLRPFCVLPGILFRSFE